MVEVLTLQDDVRVREDRAIIWGPLRREDVPERLKLRLASTPVCRERLPHEAVTPMSVEARLYEEHKIRTGRVHVERPMNVKTVHIVLCKMQSPP